MTVPKWAERFRNVGSSVPQPRLPCQQHRHRQRRRPGLVQLGFISSISLHLFILVYFNYF